MARSRNFDQNFIRLLILLQVENLAANMSKTEAPSQSTRHALAGDECGVRGVGGNGGPPATAGRRVVTVASG
jgi:hypothetical protein